MHIGSAKNFTASMFSVVDALVCNSFSEHRTPIEQFNSRVISIDQVEGSRIFIGPTGEDEHIDPPFPETGSKRCLDR